MTSLKARPRYNIFSLSLILNLSPLQMPFCVGGLGYPEEPIKQFKEPNTMK